MSPGKADKPLVIRDRIKEFRRVAASELLANPGNLRHHPPAQRSAISESLQLIGIADTLTAYASPRQGGRLTLIDGHERLQGHALDWPVLILDVSDEEADLLLATLHPIADLAELAATKARLLLDGLVAGMPSLDDLLTQLRRQVAADQPQLPPLPPEVRLASPPPSYSGSARQAPAQRPSGPPARGLGEPPDDLSGSVSQEVWVRLEVIFGSDAVPAAVAGLLAQAVARMEADGDVTGKNRWQALEYMALAYLNEPQSS